MSSENSVDSNYTVSECEQCFIQSLKYQLYKCELIKKKKKSLSSDWRQGHRVLFPAFLPLFKGKKGCRQEEAGKQELGILEVRGGGGRPNQ